MRRVTILLFYILFLIPCIVNAGIKDGLVAYYPFNGDTNDESGNGNHGTISGATLTEDRHGFTNSAYYFDGLDDYINIGNNPKLRPGLPISFAAWVRTDNVKYQGVFRNNYYTTQYTGIIVNFMDTGQIGIGFGDGGGRNITNRRTIISGVTFDTGTWYHIAGVLRGPTDMDLYINGVLDNSAYHDGSGGNLYYNDRDGIIGLHAGSGGDHFFHGAMDDIRFYNRDLSESEIRQLAGINIPSVPSLNTNGCLVVVVLLSSVGLLALIFQKRRN